MRYREFSPCDQLARWIRCYWILEGVTAQRTVERVFPDGCMELVVHLGEPFEAPLPDGTFVPQARATLHGQLQRFAVLLPPRCARTVGIRFQPAGAAWMTPLPLCELRDRSVPLEDVQVQGGHEFVDRLKEAASEAALAATIDGFLLSILDPPNDMDPLVEDCVRAIEQSKGRCRIAEVAVAAGLSRRQLERRFDKQVGLTPKAFATIVRFQGVFRLLEQEHGTNLTQAALLAGYFDQAHFIRTFKRLTGLAPSRFFRAPGSLAPLFAGN